MPFLNGTSMKRKCKINQKETLLIIFSMAEGFSGSEQKKEDLMEWMPYVRRGATNVDFEAESREKLKRLEIEKNNSNEN